MRIFAFKVPKKISMGNKPKSILTKPFPDACAFRAGKQNICALHTPMKAKTKLALQRQKKIYISLLKTVFSSIFFFYL